MKCSTITILLAIILNSFTSLSQAQFKSIGLKGGYNISRTLAWNDPNYSSKPFSRKGINYGLFTEYYLGYNTFIRLEAIYSERGFQVYDPQEIGTFILKYNYIEIPVLLQYKFLVGFFLKPKIFAGQEMSFLNDAVSELEIQGFSIGKDYKDELNPHKYGIITGIGSAYKFFYGIIDLDIRYDFGISDILADKYSNPNLSKPLFIF